MTYQALYAAYQDGMEDFWERRQNKPRYSRQVSLSGRKVDLSSNHRGALAAIDHCLPLYSVAPEADHEPFSIQFAVQAAEQSPGPVPDNLFDLIRYSGHAGWLAMQLGPWGHCTVDLPAGRAVAVLTPDLAERPELIGLCLLNTVITNFLIAGGYGMLHASCVYRDRRAVLIMADHNRGKSTTALRLALAGYPLLSDSMIFLPPDSEELQLLGFPVGKVKLRQDMVAEFPRVQPFLVAEPVRGETKYSLDLRSLDASLVEDKAAFPLTADLCLLERGSGVNSHLEVVSPEKVMDAVMHNSLFYDTGDVWYRNLQATQRLLDRAHRHRLVIGSDAAGVVETIAALWDGSRA